MVQENKELRMDAYYFGFYKTGVYEIDLILSAVACAGKAYHHTDGWNDEVSLEGMDGSTPALWIQHAADKAAESFKALTGGSGGGMKHKISADLHGDLKKLLVKLGDRLFALGEMDKAPCFFCGYNGPGYYNQDTHPCAERHYRLHEGVVKS